MLSGKGQNDQRGAFLLATALLLPFLLAALGMAVDFGDVFMQKSRLQNAADAAALAGAKVYVQELKSNNAAAADQAFISAKQYVTANASDATIDVLDLKKSQSDAKTLYYVAKLEQSVPLSFLRYFGIDSITIEAMANVKLTSQGTNTNTFPLFENLVTFSDRFNVVNSKMKSWDGNIIHTKENSYININDNPNNLLKSSTGTTINPRDKQYYDPALSISLTADSNKGLKNYIDSLMTSANTKKVNGQSISSADLSSTVNWFPDRISEIKLNQAIGSANTTKILILSQGAANIHVSADTVGKLIIFDLSTEQLHIATTASDKSVQMRSLIYTPNSEIMMNPNGLNFYGSLVSRVVDIQAATGTFTYEAISADASGGSGGTASYSAALVSDAGSDIVW